MHPKIDVMHGPEFRRNPKQFVKSSFTRILLTGPSNETHNESSTISGECFKWKEIFCKATIDWSNV